jgi:hypothetical protein
MIDFELQDAKEFTPLRPEVLVSSLTEKRERLMALFMIVMIKV